MITIPIWLFALLIGFSVPTIMLMVLCVIYFIAGIHDLHFVRYHKDTYKECPYEMESKE